MTGDARRYARVPAAMGRAGWRRDAEHTASAGQLTGRGTSQQTALDDLSGQLEAMAGRALQEPAFWWDADNQALHVVTPDPVTGGHFAWIVRMAGDGPVLSPGMSCGKAPVGDALTTAVGMERVPRGRRPR
jgi:hypothetical protein